MMIQVAINPCNNDKFRIQTDYLISVRRDNKQKENLPISGLFSFG